MAPSVKRLTLGNNVPTACNQRFFRTTFHSFTQVYCCVVSSYWVRVPWLNTYPIPIHTLLWRSLAVTLNTAWWTWFGSFQLFLTWQVEARDALLFDPDSRTHAGQKTHWVSPGRDTGFWLALTHSCHQQAVWTKGWDLIAWWAIQSEKGIVQIRKGSKVCQI